MGTLLKDRQMRRVLVLVLAALLWAPALVCAIGLGNIETRSALNQPFNARIPLIHATADEIDSLKVQLADAAQFQRAGIDLTGTLLKLRFKVKQAGKGPDYIEITSHDSIREPFLNFLLEIDWPKGRLIREYTVLLDPPFYSAEEKMAIHPAATAAPAPLPAAVPPPAAPSRSTSTATSSSGAAPARTAAASREAGGPVKAGDTLWSLADRMRPDSSVSIQQMMLALLHANPDAFVDGNVNGLKKGFVLKTPERGDITSISQEQALAEVRKQYAAWEQFRESMAKNVPAQPKGPVAQTEAGAPEAAPGSGAAPATDEAHLKLLSAKEGGAQEEIARQLAVAKETLDSKEQENADLKSQLVESEQIIEKLKSRVALQDDQLAALQAKLSGMQAQPETPAPEQAKPAAPAETPPAAEQSAPAVEAPAPETKPAEMPKPAAPEKPETAASTPAPAPATPAPAKPAPTAARSILDQATDLVSTVIPKAVLETLPGGVLTVLGGVAVVVLGLIALLAKLAGRGRREASAPMQQAATPALDEKDAEAVTHFDEPVTETRDEEEPTVGAFDAGSTTQLEVTQIGGAQPSAAGGEGEEDPLAEVNVYLAYERFDEAEKVVKDAIARYPDEPKYKLRLLEVYYSSNNKAAYEDAAHSLHDAVDGSGPLWDSAVAMWREMSPDRELFAASDEDRTATAVDAAPERQFVDITADDEQPSDEMSDTVSATVGEPPAATSDTGGSLDFDLGTGEEAESGDVLDLTAGSEADGMLDITAGESEEILDLTAPSGEMEEAPAPAEETPTEAPVAPDLEETVDRFAKSTSDDLLDVTKGGDLSAGEHKDLLNMTSPGAMEEGAEESVLDITGGHEEPQADNVIEFDLGGGLEAPPTEPAEEGVFDITTGDSEPGGGELPTETPEADSNMLEFDIGALDSGSETEIGTGTIPADASSEQETLNLDDALNAAPQDSRTVEEHLNADLESGAGLEINLDDASLSNLNEPSPDETMDLSSEDLTQSMEDLSLDDLTKSLEDTLTGLQKSAEPEEADNANDDFSFDLDSGDQGEHLSTLDMGEAGGEQPKDEHLSTLDMGEAGGEQPKDEHLSTLDMGEQSANEHLSTVEMDEPSISEGDLGVEKTVVMPKHDIETQSMDDEVDTKLNLAKAYIELGDAAGARTILNEVVAEGTATQQEEAQKLLQDMD
jgi:pilus assembly protein FimV